MSTFWLLATAMTLVALLFTLPPLLRSRRSYRTDLDQLNAEVIRDQLAELRAEHEAGRLDDRSYEAARLDLQRELLDDVDPADKPAAAENSRSGRWIAVVVLVLVPAAAVLLYQQLGAPGIIERLSDWQQARSAAAGQQHSLESMVDQLAERMRAEPDNIEGWIMLGRSYAALKRYDAAVGAYRQAYRLAGDQPALLTDYADVLVSANGGRFTDEAGTLLDKALAIQPDDLKALWLRGHWKYQRDDYSGAIADWKHVAGLLPEGDENRDVIIGQIRRAQAELGQGGLTSAASGDKATAQPGKAAVPVRIHVTVALDPALANQASPDDTVFVFARAARGPKMPLAIVRKQVRDLPLSVTLDDSMAMTPAMKLSSFDQVTIGARISKSGQAMPASGDLQGLVTPVGTRGDKDVKITIDTMVP